MQNGFGSETEYDGNGTGNTVVVADVNGEGLPDLVVANNQVVEAEENYNPGNVTILLNQGNGTFAPGATYALPTSDEGFYPGGPTDVATGDLYGNGRTDVVVTDSHGNLTILPNDGNGVFGTPDFITVPSTADGTYSPQVMVVDVNGDGSPDLLVGGGAQSSTDQYALDNGVELLLNNGHGGFAPAVDYANEGTQIGGVTTGFTTADVNGDGRPDLITLRGGVQYQGADSFTVSANDGAGGFAAPVNYTLQPSGSGPLLSVSLSAGDLEGSGHADVIVSYAAYSGTGSLQVYANDGAGAFGTPPDTLTETADFGGGAVTVADINGDGRPDLVVAGYDYANKTNATDIFLSNGDGAFAAPTLYDGLSATAAADLNGDGKLDLVGTGFLHATSAGDSQSVVVALQGPNEPAVCYAAGTRILTRQGEVAVEALREGDEVMTLLGQGFASVTWLGHHRMNLKTHPEPRAVQPVRILAGAFGPGRPARDLRVSPGHALYVDGVLIQAERLVNGATVRREAACETVVYWHVELDRHDVLMAEGLPAESYLDTGNRTAFVGGGDFVQLHPDFSPRHWAETCAPMMHEGPMLEAVKARLLRRAHDAFGWQVSREPGLHVLADGAAIAGEASDGVHRFALPAGCRELRLVSRRWVPAEMLSGSTDMRVLGVCVRRLVLDGHDVALDDASLCDGWDKPERDDRGPQRWTTGSAALPIGSAELVVELDGLFATWTVQEPAPSARSA